MGYPYSTGIYSRLKPVYLHHKYFFTQSLLTNSHQNLQIFGNASDCLQPQPMHT